MGIPEGLTYWVVWDVMPFLLADLDAFYLEHRQCGELESEISEGECSWIVMACSCGAQLARRTAGGTGEDSPPGV